MDDTSDFVTDDELVVAPLQQLGVEVKFVSWRASVVDWSSFDQVVIRSTWDYQQDPRRFLQTLEKIDASSAKLLNPLSVVEWNIDKSYLFALRQAGVSIVPGWQTDHLSVEQLERACANLGAESIVVKPVIGANADDTFVVSQEISSQERQAIVDIFTGRSALLQPFVASVKEVGEYSLFFFRGEYSHAILKTPKAGDFRVQEEHGGLIQATEPAPDLATLAQAALQAVPHDLLYARVDIVRLDNGTPAVMELELIEPSLYLSFCQDAPVRFAKSILAR